MAEYILNYELGDSTHDGHCITETGQIKVNHSNAELKKAIAAFNKETGCNWEKWCEDYDDRHISEEDTKKICEYCHIDMNDEDSDWDIENGKFCLSCGNDYIDLLMTICQVKLPNLKWDNYYPNNAGDAFFTEHGYGLFFS